MLIHNFVAINIFCFQLAIAQVKQDVDGYFLFIPMVHVWKFKTVFTNWYTKNWASAAAPLAFQWDLSEKHVSRIDLAFC